ncbi:hypothetical protein FB45DRAFT_905947 [Roridomyces roridus]|uniref:Uncharacterized protein n=1 Tax=Roridomyces roridus TaxID=1738132 RepID=A0AAD7C7S8_9AGAR|nr:hypothetical protein FB45DRAFT_905947 [Roridomyces roridus]
MLAQELIDIIVDEVAHTDDLRPVRDHTALKACSLTARAFRVRSQRRLFQSLTLKSPNIDHVCVGFIQNPTLASYVRDFCLHLPHESFSQLLSSFFPLLKNLDRLFIQFERQSFAWRQSPAQLVFPAELIQLLSLPTLRCFGLQNCSYLPFSVMRYATRSFEEVVLVHVDGRDDKACPLMDEASLSNDIPALRRLLLQPPGTFKSFLLHEGNASILKNLRDIELRLGDYERPPSVDSDIPVKLMSIPHLSVDVDVFWTAAHCSRLLYFPKMPHIRVLTLKSRTSQLHIAESLQCLALRLPTCMPNLEVLNFFFDSQTVDPTKPHYPEMDDALANLTFLREVNFITGANSYNRFYMVEDSLRGALPLASDAGLLRIKSSKIYSEATRRRPIYLFSS